MRVFQPSMASTASSPKAIPPPTAFEQKLGKEADDAYGKGSGTVWTQTARLLEANLAALGHKEAGALSITEESTLNNRLTSPGLVRTSPKLIVYFSGIGADPVDDRLDEFVPLTRHLSTVAIAERGKVVQGVWGRDKSKFTGGSFKPDKAGLWRVTRIVEVAGIGIASQIAKDFPLASVRTVPLKPIVPSKVKAAAVDLAKADLKKLVKDFASYLDARGLVYDPLTQLDFLSVALASQFVLFAGPSGSGKSTAARALADFFATTWVQIEVPRGLHRHEEFVGYYSHFSKIFADTAFLGSLREMEVSANTLPPACILEESNLSPFEGYMSAGLHGLGALEAPFIGFNLHKQSSPVTLADNVTTVPTTLEVGPYPRFLGTVNVDATAPAPANKISGRAAVVLVEPPAIDDALAAVRSATSPPTHLHRGDGAGVLGQPADALRLSQKTNREPDILKALRAGANLLEQALKANVITPRDASRMAMFVAAFDLLAQAGGHTKADALGLGVEYAILHFVLPRMSGDGFDSAVNGLVDGGGLRSDGPLMERLAMLKAAESESGFGVPADFWTALS